MVEKYMAEGCFLHVDHAPRSCTYMGSTAKKRAARTLDMLLMPKTGGDNGAHDQYM